MKLVVADLSNIEGRISAWLAGEHWKIDAFRAYDAGTGPDLYKVAYSNSFAVPVEQVTKPQRQTGKTMELAGGYQGSVGAYVTMAANLDVKVEDIVSVARSATSDAIWHETRERYTKRWSAGLDPETWTGLKVVVDAWRGAHPAIRSLWYDLENAAVDVVADPTATRIVRRLKLDMRDGYLRIRKPNGIYLTYKDMTTTTECGGCEGTGRMVSSGAFVICDLCDGKGSGKPRLSFWGSRNGKWLKINTYGGSILENLCQSVARDVFFDGFKRAEAAGYPVVLRVHDELICEVPDEPGYTHERLSEMMATNPPWADGLPLAAAGSSMYRYAKGD